jgi:hypothetical protein
MVVAALEDQVFCPGKVAVAGLDDNGQLDTICQTDT